MGVDHAVLHADQHCCHGGQGGADDEGQGDDAVGVDAQQVGHLQVFGAGTTGTSEARALDEERQAEHRNDGDGEDQDLHVGHDHAVHRAFAEYQIARHQVGNGFVLGVLGQQHEVLQEDRHADRRDQRNQPVAAAQGSIGYPFDAVAVGAGDDHRSGEGADHQDRQCIEPHHRQADDHDEGDIRADHVHLAVGEVDHADDAVDHRVTDGDQGVGTANGQAVDQLLKVVVKLRHHISPEHLASSARPPRRTCFEHAARRMQCQGPRADRAHASSRRARCAGHSLGEGVAGAPIACGRVSPDQLKQSPQRVPWASIMVGQVTWLRSCCRPGAIRRPRS